MKLDLPHWPYTSALLVVAHPDDETIWAVGTILMHSESRWTVAGLCHRHDPDRAPKFRNVLELLGASGELGVDVQSAHFEPAQETEWCS